MHDQDLRRRALESKKTVSKKAASRQSPGRVSRTISQPGSSPTSRNQSRAASPDDDGGILSDDTAYSINSVDEFLASDDFNEATPDSLRTQLSERIDELLARKGSTNKGREDCLATYVRIVSAHLLADMLYGRVADLVSTLARSIKAETSERETVFALKALALTAISIRDDELYDSVSNLLKRTISDSSSLKTKAAAIYCLGDCLSFGGGGDDEILDQMTFLLEVISSDGSFIDAADDVDTVVAALRVYGFLATQIDDVEAESEDAIEAFAEQLDSASPEVQLAAGENIALFYEKAYSGRTSTDSDESDEEPDENHDAQGAKRYEPYHNTHEIATKVEAISTISTKKVHRRFKRDLHQTFTAILLAIQNPTWGIQINNRSAMVVRIHQDGEIYVDRWWKLARLSALRRLLQGGFINHYYEGNKAVLDMLPVIIDRTYSQVNSSDKASGKKYKDQSYSPRSLSLLQGE